MRLKLFLMALLMAVVPALAQKVSIFGTVVDDRNGSPIKGSTVMLRDQGLQVTTGVSGEFSFSNAQPGTDYILVMTPDGSVSGIDINVLPGDKFDVGQVRVVTVDSDQAEYSAMAQELIFDENVFDDEESAAQSVSALTGASDNIFYNTASYNFGPMYYNFRGYNSAYQDVYLNGVKMNDLVRGRFNFNSLLGMTSRAFRNKTSAIGLGAADFGFGNIGGAVNYNTITSGYAPGFNGSLAYTNSNYMLRAMATYSTGILPSGWAFTVSGIGRYANEGVVEGTFYNSGGLFLSAEKIFNKHHSLTLTAFGGPTQRANSSATYQEAYDLAGSNLYNPNWGYQNGDKRAARIVESFDPTVMLNWIYKNDRTMVNTAAALQWVQYSSSALNWYKANDPNPTYYRYLPSYFKDQPEQYDLYYDLWTNDKAFRQIKWDDLYQANYLNNEWNKNVSVENQVGSSYIQENRHSNEFKILLNSYVNHRLNDAMSLQAGVSLNNTRATYYKTIRDLLGGQFWLDIDPFSDRDITLNPELLQNNMKDPNRRVGKGDKFGYFYHINALQVTGWLQNTITLPKWDINYGVEMKYTQFQRDGEWQNGRAPQNSLGKGVMHRFDDAVAKAGATYKINGRNLLQVHAQYGTQAPLIDNAYISPRNGDAAAANLKSERILSFDGSYIWNYRRFRGIITGFFTQINDATERTSFYDDRYSTYTNFVLSGVKKVYKGVEVGMSYKITPSLTATFAGTYARYQYKNNPLGTRSVENGMSPDTTQTVYLKNYFVGSTPQFAGNIGLDYAAPKNWFFGINATYQGDSYVNLSPVYHEAIPELANMFPNPEKLEEKVRELAQQDKLKNAFSLNLSIGKAIYFRGGPSLNINLNINNVLNNKNVCTYAYQQSRMDTKEYVRDAYPNKYTYAQGIRLFLNVGIRF